MYPVGAVVAGLVLLTPGLVYAFLIAYCPVEESLTPTLSFLFYIGSRDILYLFFYWIIYELNSAFLFCSTKLFSFTSFASSWTDFELWALELYEVTDDVFDALLVDIVYVDNSGSLIKTVHLIAESCPVNFSRGLTGFLRS